MRNTESNFVDDTTSRVSETTLGNGLRVVTERLSGSLSAAIGVWIAVGSRDENVRLSGASHCLEHLLFKGTETRSARDVAEAVDRVGGDMNAFTAREYTAFYARVPATSFDMAADLLFDVIRRPAFRERDVESERQVILEELVAAEDTPDDLVHMALYESLFTGHPLGRDVLGNHESIAALQPHDIADFHAEHYRPTNMVVAAAGNVDHAAVVRYATEHFGDLPTGVAPSRNAPLPGTPTQQHARLPVEQMHVALGWRSLPHGDPDRFALALANTVLGGSPSSRLFQQIREEQGLAYTVFSSTSSYADTGTATVYAATSARRGAELLPSLRDEIDRAVSGGMTADEIDMARDGFKGSVVLGLEDSSSRMSRLATGHALRGRVTPLEEFFENLDAVTLEDVSRVLDRVFGTEPTVSIVGPDGPIG